MEDYLDMSPKQIERLLTALENEIQSYSDDDLRDPALYYEYMEKCSQFDDVVMAEWRAREQYDGTRK